MRLLAHIDGGARGNPGPAGYGVSIESDPQDLAAPGPDPARRSAFELYGFIGIATNNTAEYAALLALLEHVGPLRPDSLTIRSDSELLVRQMRGEYRVKDAKLQILHAAARRLLNGLPHVVFEHVPREENRAADALANRAMDLQESSGPLPAALRSLPRTPGGTANLPSL
jgi:probable phosphoglycerate mutase